MPEILLDADSLYLPKKLQYMAIINVSNSKDNENIYNAPKNVKQTAHPHVITTIGQ